MAAQPLVSFRTGGCANPAPDGGVVGPQAALHQQFLDITQGKRIPQLPTNRAQDELVLGLSRPLRSPVEVSSSRDLQATRRPLANVATHPRSGVGCTLNGLGDPKWNPGSVNWLSRRFVCRVRPPVAGPGEARAEFEARLEAIRAAVAGLDDQLAELFPPIL